MEALLKSRTSGGDKIIYINDSLVAGKKISEEGVMGMLKGPRVPKLN